MSGFRVRYLGPVVLIALCLLTLCTVTAVSLLREQATLTGVLRENVNSRRAAADLRGTLNVLIALERHHVESVADLHAKAQSQIAELRHVADHPEERELADRLDEAYPEYLRRWHAMPGPADPGHESAVEAATRFLETEVLFRCRDFEAYNDRRIEETTAQHERVLGRLAWGVAAVAVCGGVAGLVLGFGVARELGRSIRRLRVQLRDAAGKLGPPVPEIVLTELGDFHGLHAEVDRLTERIEAAVSTLQQRDREVLRSEQLAAVGQLAAGVAHEVRNPLTAIKMLVQVARETGDKLPAEDLAVIETEVRRMEETLRTFLEFARPPRLQKAPVDLAAAIRGVADLVHGRADKQRVTVLAEAPADGVPVVADGQQLRQVLVNLTLNALDAMPTGGTLRLVARRRPGGVAEVEVADTGPGISRAVLPRLFEPFASGKDTGLGLGLVISKRIVDDHGGTIAAANRPDGGASFFVTLPADRPGK